MSGKQAKRARAALKAEISYLERWANLGNENAQISLGYIYLRRSALGPMDLKKGFYWLKLAADQGNPEASLDVAGFYLEGNVVEKDMKLFAKYFYAHHQKTDSEEYRLWVECGFDEEFLVEHYEWQQKIKETFDRKFKEEFAAEQSKSMDNSTSMISCARANHG